MLKDRSLAMIVAVGLGAMALPASAQEVLVDYNPGTGDYGGVWYNECCDHYYAEDVTFDVDTNVTGLDIYTDFQPNALGDYQITIWFDDGFGTPADVWMQWSQPGTGVEVESHHSMTFYRHEVDFDPITFEAGVTYWIGMTSVSGWHLGQTSVLSPDDGLMAWFQGCCFYAFTDVGDMSFRLRGEVGGGLVATFDCPPNGGRATFSVTGGTPDGSAAVVYGTNSGPFAIPNNLPCAGTMLSVAPPFMPGAPVRTRFDSNGELTLTGNVPGGVCDRILIEVIDLTTCETATP